MTDVKTICSDDYKNQTRYGILNEAGDFWTPDSFKSEDAAKDSIKAFWKEEKAIMRFMGKCSIVPVSVTLSYTPPNSNDGEA